MPLSLRRRRSYRQFGEQRDIVVHLVRGTALGILAGVLAGCASWVFLRGLEWITRQRLTNPWLIWLLPVAGLIVGLAYAWVGGRAARGSALLLDEIHSPTSWVPRRMAPLVLAGTWLTHLVGGSAGREGTALQMSGSLADGAARLFRLRAEDRRVLLIAALAGGFGAVFGVPVAGAVFALEVLAVGRMRYDALVPALAASVVGDLVVRRFGLTHEAHRHLEVALDGGVILRVALAGLVFGVAGIAFVELTDGIKEVTTRLIRWRALIPVVGGFALLGLIGLFGRDYLGLSLPLVERALSGERLSGWVPVLKLVFTAVTLGCAFPGGEVTPLFVIGGTLGAVLAVPLHLPPAMLAAVGFVSVFAGAANTPLACTVMAVEIFGAGIAVPAAIGCVAAYVFSSHRGIYSTQRIHVTKDGRSLAGSVTVHDWRHRDDRGERS